MSYDQSLHVKILSLDELARKITELKKEGKSIVHCHGVFDLLHPGHVKHLTRAKQEGNILAVTIPADKYVKRGPGRPIFTQNLRAEQLAALSSVDYVSIAETDAIESVIARVSADVFVVGNDSEKNHDWNSKAIRSAVASIGARLYETNDPVSFSSTALINRYVEAYPKKTREYTASIKKDFSIPDIFSYIDALSSKKILVIGDSIIDQYSYTIAMGKSSKAPLVVHRFVEEESFAGGILATSGHIAALGAKPKMVTVLGKSESWEKFIRSKLSDNVIPKFFYQSGQPTLVDKRYVDYYTKQKLFQVAFFKPQSITKHTEDQVVSYLKTELPKSDIVIVNDFGRGFITERIVRLITALAPYIALNVQANSANYGFNVVTKYPRADFICLDEVELRLATHDRYTELPKLIKRIARQMETSMLIVTRGSDGSIIYEKGKGIQMSPALALSVVDPVGAGDAFFAVASPLAAVGAPAKLVAFMGNIAGALKVQIIGNKSAIDGEELRGFIIRLLT